MTPRFDPHYQFPDINSCFFCFFSDYSENKQDMVISITKINSQNVAKKDSL